MKARQLLFLLAFSLAVSVFAQPARTLGGDQDEVVNALAPAADSGWFAACYTLSYGAGQGDLLLVRFDKHGKERWRTLAGGIGQDMPNTVMPTADGGAVVAGYSRNAETKRTGAWLARFNAAGKLLWEHSYLPEQCVDVPAGCAGEFRGIVETPNGGFMAVGSVRLYPASSGRSGSDVWLLRLTPGGEVLWNRNYGKAVGDESGDALVALPDGDVMVAGYTDAIGSGAKDMLVMRINATGREKWSRTFGGEFDEEAETAILLSDGSVALGGWTGTGTHGRHDGYVCRITQDGGLIWQKSFGGSDDDAIIALAKGVGNTVIACGWTRSFGPATRLWVNKLSETGGLVWDRTSVGPRSEYGRAILPRPDGGYLVGGSTESEGAGGRDAFFLPLSAQGDLAPKPDDVQPAPIPVTPGFLPAGSVVPNPFMPNLYVLAVGVSKYQDADVNLAYAHADAAAIADTFQAMEGQLFGKVLIRKLLNEDATLVNIKTAIGWLEREATQKDVVLIFFSSHGALDNKGNLYILPTDFNGYNLFATALNIKDLTEGMSAAPCKKLILLDACHSGQSGADLMSFASAKAADIDRVVNEIAETEPGITVMTSSSGREYSYETDEWQHGAFTKAMLEGLRGYADYNLDHVISLAELNLFVTERVKLLTYGKQHPFTPINLFGDMPIFVVEQKP